MAIRMTFYGAAGVVTGSACHVQTDRASVLVDFGLFQGGKKMQSLNRVPQALKPAKLNAVLVTHAHLDHTGRLPLLPRTGFAGPIYCTPATIELTGLILRDSVKLQAQDLHRINRKRQRADRKPQQPLYTLEDVERLLGMVVPVEYQNPIVVAPGIQARFVEAGHLLGSASIDLQVGNGSGKKHIVFSGDLGQTDTPILKDPAGFDAADVVALESTYGDHNHKPFDETVAEFERIVQDVVKERGRILVPTFAVGRAQLLLYLLALMFRRGVVPKFPVFVDSPMAVEATGIYARHLELFDEDFHRLSAQRPFAQDLDTVKATASADESRALNNQPGPCLIMAGAGMCNGGRILHHLRHNLWNPSTHVLIIGFQAEGTLGRRLVDRDKAVSIFGERIAVKAHVHTLGGFSAHAGQNDLLHWLGQMAASRPRVILTHGERRGREPLADLIRQRYSLDPELPTLGQTYEV